MLRVHLRGRFCFGSETCVSASVSPPAGTSSCPSPETSSCPSPDASLCPSRSDGVLLVGHRVVLVGTGVSANTVLALPGTEVCVRVCVSTGVSWNNVFSVLLPCLGVCPKKRSSPSSVGTGTSS